MVLRALVLGLCLLPFVALAQNDASTGKRSCDLIDPDLFTIDDELKLQTKPQECLNRWDMQLDKELKAKEKALGVSLVNTRIDMKVSEKCLLDTRKYQVVSDKATQKVLWITRKGRSIPAATSGFLDWLLGDPKYVPKSVTYHLHNRDGKCHVEKLTVVGKDGKEKVLASVEGCRKLTSNVNKDVGKMMDRRRHLREAMGNVSHAMQESGLYNEAEIKAEWKKKVKEPSDKELDDYIDQYTRLCKAYPAIMAEIQDTVAEELKKHYVPEPVKKVD